MENDRTDTPPSWHLIDEIASFVERDRTFVARLAGRISEEDYVVFIDLYKTYGNRLTELLKKMNNDPGFADIIFTVL